MEQLTFGLREGTFEALHALDEPVEDILARAFYDYLIEEEAKCLPEAAHGDIPPSTFIHADYDAIKVSPVPSQDCASARRYRIELPRTIFDRVDYLLAVKSIGMSRFMNNAIDSSVARLHIEAALE